MADYDLGTARGRVEIDAAGVGRGLRQANQELDRFDHGARRSAQSLALVGIGMVSAATTIAGGFGLAINAAASFEQRISGIAAVSNATEQELEALRKKALQLGADTKFSASEAAGAMEELVKAGLSVEDVLNGAADATVNLAAAGDVALVDAATIAANAMNQFGLAAADMPHVADLIAGAANASAIDVGEFGMALQQAGAVANLTGLSFDDLAVAIAAMGNAGIRGSDAGTSLKTFLQNLQPVTERQIEAFRELSLVTEDGSNAFFDEAGNIKSLAEIAGVLQGALRDMTQEQKSATLETLFGTDAIRAAAIISNEGAEGFEALAASMGEVTAQEVAEERMDNLRGSLEQLKGSVETLLIVIGTPLGESLRIWVDRLTEVVNAVASLDQHTLSLVTTVGKVVGALLGGTGSILLAAFAFGKVLSVIGALRAALVGHPLVLLAAIIAGVAAAVYQLYQTNETFRKAIQGLFSWIEATAGPILEELVKGFRAMIEAFNGEGITTNGGIVGFFERFGVGARVVYDWIVNSLIPALQDFAGFVVNDVWPVAQRVFGDVVNAVRTFVGFLNSDVKPVLTDIGAAFLWLATEVIERVVSGFQWVEEHVFPIFVELGRLAAAVGKKVGNGIDFIVDLIGDLVEVIQDLGPLWRTIWRGIQRAFETFIDIVGNIWENFGDNIWETIQNVFDIAKGIVEGALRTIQGVIQVITGIIDGDWSKVWEGIRNIFGGIWDAIKGIPAGALEFIRQTIETGVDLIATVFESLDDIIGGFFGDAWNNARSIVAQGVEDVVGFFVGLPGRLAEITSGLFDGLVTSASSAISDLLGALWALPGKLLETISGIGDAAMDIGSSIVAALRDGISSAIEGALDLADAFLEAMKSAWNWLIDQASDAWNAIEIDFPGPGPVFGLPDNALDDLKFHKGGIVPGRGEVPAILQGGEGVLSRKQMEVFNSMLRMLGSSAKDFFGSATLPSAQPDLFAGTGSVGQAPSIAPVVVPQSQSTIFQVDKVVADDPLAVMDKIEERQKLGALIGVG